ncbi:hypothetical protein ACWXWU_17790 [Shewanella sp. A14]
MAEAGYKLGLKLDRTPSKIMRFSAFFIWGAEGAKGEQAFCPFGLVWAKHHDVDFFQNGKLYLKHSILSEGYNRSWISNLKNN